jgi:hypothetical protein
MDRGFSHIATWGIDLQRVASGFAPAGGRGETLRFLPLTTCGEVEDAATAIVRKGFSGVVFAKSSRSM